MDGRFASTLMKLRLATLVFSLFPLAGTAQTVPASATPLVDRLLATDVDSASTGTPVLPIWSGSNGDLLAVVALPPGWVDSAAPATPAYAGPSTWRLAGSTSSSSGLTLRFANGMHLDALLGQYSPSIAPCVAGFCNSADMPRWSAASGVLDMGWTSAQGALDLSYGLSWLRSPVTAPGVGALLNPLPAFNVGSGPQWSTLMAEESALFARGRWHFDQGAALDLTASVGRLHGSPTAGALLPSSVDLDQLSLSLGLDVGSLRGAIVGHVLSSDDPLLAGKRWTTLDLGISWRTPWAGVLSVGAQNILSAPVNSPRDADGQARTPYIQYRQDL